MPSGLKRNGEFRSGYKPEPFMICPECGNVVPLDCEACQGQGYIPEDWQDLDAWIAWGEG